MVEVLRQGGITDERLLAAMAEVPRHLFVPASYRNQAYSEDVSINIGEGQTISQPRVMALMTEAARIQPENRVLEIGTGSGYQAAVLAKLARFVFTVERIPSLARSAKQRLDSLGIENVSVKVMDGTLGWSAQAPFDAILVTAAAPEFPPATARAARGRRPAGDPGRFAGEPGTVGGGAARQPRQPRPAPERLLRAVDRAPRLAGGELMGRGSSPQGGGV